jgi:uncharacterized membrane protein
MSIQHGIACAIATLLSTSLLSGCATQVAASKHAAAIEQGAPERCFGVARGGRNDCKTDAHICAGWAYHDSDPQAFVYVPAGTCERIVGSLPDPAVTFPSGAP